MNTLKLLIAATLFSTLGCQTNPVKTACNETDWFELGRRDGASGVTSQVGSHRLRCGKFFNPLNESQFTSGYNNGLTEYCSADNGFAIGRSGAKAAKVCPAPMDVPFLSAFAKGQEARLLADTNQKIDRQISSLNEKLNQGKVKSSDDVLLELTSLERERAENERKIDAIQRQVN